MTSLSEIAAWFQDGLDAKAEFMLVVTDTFDYTDYPVYVRSEDEFDVKLREHQDPNKMSRVMEVYDLHIPWSEQSSPLIRVWNTPAKRRAGGA